MTFRESEFPNMVHQLGGISKTYPPEAVAAFVEEMLRIYKAIPLYPGLVCMCMGRAFEKWDPKNPPPSKGSFVVVRLKGKPKGRAVTPIAGTLTAWGAAAVQIEFRDPFGKLRRTRIPRRQIESVEKFHRDTLERLWPTLVFDQKPRRAPKAEKS